MFALIALTSAPSLMLQKPIFVSILPHAAEDMRWLPRKHSIQAQISKIKVESVKILNRAEALWTQLPLGPIICEGKWEVLKPLRARRVRHREEPWTGNTGWCSASGASEGPHVVTRPVKGSRARVHGLRIPAVQFGLHLWNPGGTQGW